MRLFIVRVCVLRRCVVCHRRPVLIQTPTLPTHVSQCCTLGYVKGLSIFTGCVVWVYYTARLCYHLY